MLTTAGRIDASSTSAQLIGEFIAVTSSLRSRATTDKRRRELSHFADSLNGRPLTSAKPADVAAYAATLHVTATTKTTYLSGIGAFYRWAVGHGLVATNPVVEHRRGVPRRPRGNPRRRSETPLTLLPLAMQYVNDRRRRGELEQATVDSLNWSLYDFALSFGSRPLAQLTEKAIDRWLEQITHLAPGTRRNRLGAVRGFCSWLVEERIIARTPMLRRHRVKVPRRAHRSMRPDQVSGLWIACVDSRDRLLVWLGVGLALRCVEISRLEVGDYDQVQHTMHVRGKGSHERQVPVPAEVGRALAEYFADVGEIAGPLVRSKLDPVRGISPSYVAHRINKLFAGSGVKRRPYDGLSAHALRHTAATDVYKRCKDLTIVRDMLGHSNIQATSVYLGEAALDDMREAMAGRQYRDASPPS
ncbi:MAG: hypothetical protein QOD92_3927 [Acidimicrobiaceae bacterium]|jgi:site-specific recombinase XerD